jgi:AAA domain/DnaB-like helicase N terminal domain
LAQRQTRTLERIQSACRRHAPAVAMNAMINGHERVLLAALLNGTTELPVTAEDFSSPPNRTIFSAIEKSPRSKRNLLGVQDALRASGKLKSIGGEAGLTQIFCETVSPEILEYALDCVLEDSRKRRRAEIGKALHRGDIEIPEAVEQLNQLQEPGAAGLPLIEDAAELISKPIVLPDDVIEGVLHRGGKMVLGGASKTFKTWTLVDLAVSVAAGRDWLGKFPAKRGRVLSINLELQSAFFGDRVRVVFHENQVKPELNYLMVWNLRGHAADLSKLQPLILQRIGGSQYELIILDPIYKLLGQRDENKAGDIASLLNEIESLAVKTGAAVAFGAHYSKGNQAGKEVIDRIGGSGVFARDPDSILNFTRHEQDDCFTVEATLRNHPPIKPFVVRWEYPLMCVDSLLDPAQLKRAGAAVKQFHDNQLLNLLTDPMSAVEFRKLAEKKIGMSERTFYRLFADLKESDAVKENKNGKWEKT